MACLLIQFQISRKAEKDQEDQPASLGLSDQTYSWRELILIESRLVNHQLPQIISAFFPHTLYTPDTARLPRGLNSWMCLRHGRRCVRANVTATVCACVRVCLCCVCVCVCVSAVTVYHNGGRGSRSMPRNRGTLESRAHQQASACSDVPIRSGRRALSFANAHACSPMLSQGAFNPLPPRRPGRERERERGGRRQEAGRVGEEIYVAGCLKEDLTSVSRVSPVRFITRHFHDRFSHRFRSSIRTIVRPNWSARSPKDER